MTSIIQLYRKNHPCAYLWNGKVSVWIFGKNPRTHFNFFKSETTRWIPPLPVKWRTIVNYLTNLCPIDFSVSSDSKQIVYRAYGSSRYDCVFPLYVHQQGFHMCRSERLTLRYTWLNWVISLSQCSCYSCCCVARFLSIKYTCVQIKVLRDVTEMNMYKRTSDWHIYNKQSITSEIMKDLKWPNTKFMILAKSCCVRSRHIALCNKLLPTSHTLLVAAKLSATTFPLGTHHWAPCKTPVVVHYTFNTSRRIAVKVNGDWTLRNNEVLEYVFAVLSIRNDIIPMVSITVLDNLLAYL